MFFSIVIPLYNKQECISNTLRSVLNQSYENYEIIVVDDGSTDESKSIVSSFSDSCIKLISQDNGGPSCARNRGIKEASSEFITFLDADDLWEPEYLKEMDSLIRRFPDALCWGFNYSSIENGIVTKPGSKVYSGYFNNKWDFTSFPFCTISCCCRKSSLIELGGFDERMRYGEDLDMWFRLLLAGRGVIDSRILAFYNQDVTDSLMRHKIPLEKHIPYFIDKYADARKNNVAFRRYFDEQMIFRLYPYLFDKRYKKAARSLAKKLDYSLLKRSMWFRMEYPYTYRFLRSIKESL